MLDMRKMLFIFKSVGFGLGCSGCLPAGPWDEVTSSAEGLRG